MAYTEIAGRTHDKQADKIVYFTLGVCAAVGEVPRISQTLTVADGYIAADIAHTLPAVCLAVKTDKLRYPGRIFVTAVWDAPLLLTEVGTF